MSYYFYGLSAVVLVLCLGVMYLYFPQAPVPTAIMGALLLLAAFTLFKNGRLIAQTKKKKPRKDGGDDASKEG